MSITTKYQQTLDYLFSQLPMYQRVGKAAFKKDLTNILALTAELGDPQLDFPSIHIAGTNGKGSSAHMLSAVFQAQGLRVGLYTSPHYQDFRERIKINGTLIPKAYVVDFVEQHGSLFDQIRPSFFEISVALAFKYFADQKVDLAIIETGMGGRLDSTNIINPLLCLITNISYDHQQFLGNTLALIAGEKAGIIKKETPIVIGERHPETEAVFIKKAKKMKAPIHFAEDHYEVIPQSYDLDHTNYAIHGTGDFTFPELRVNIAGTYQSRNLQGVLMTLEVYNKVLLKHGSRLPSIGRSHIESGLKVLKKSTYFLGRWQVLGQKPLILADSAHNEAGLRLVMEQISKIDAEQLHIVLGVVNDKEVAKVLSMFPPSAKYYFAKANIPRGLDARILREQGRSFGLEGRAYVSVKNALQAARRHANAGDLIFVGGSTFVVAEVV